MFNIGDKAIYLNGGVVSSYLLCDVLQISIDLDFCLIRPYLRISDNKNVICAPYWVRKKTLIEDKILNRDRKLNILLD